MVKHHLAFPDHRTPVRNNQYHTNSHSINGTNSFLFDELMKVMGTAPHNERIPKFLAEISNFVNKVHLFKPKILQKEPSTHPPIEYYVDKNVSKFLDLPEGLLQLNESAFDDNFQQSNNTFGTYIEDRTTDNSNLQSLRYDMNLFPQVNYDQISDNAVEAAEVLGKSNGNESPIFHSFGQDNRKM